VECIGSSYLLLSCTLSSIIFMHRLQHSILISFVIVTGFLCMLHTYNITPIAKIWLSFWVCSLHCVITKVNCFFLGYLCMYVFIYLLVATVLSIYSSTSLTSRFIYHLRGCRTPRGRRIGSHRLIPRWGDQRSLVAENLGLAFRIHIFIDFLEAQLLCNIIPNRVTMKVSTLA